MEEEEGYMALNFRPRKEHGTPQCAQWHRVALGVASVVILLLTRVVITLTSEVLQNKGTECLPDPEFRLQLKNFACSSPGNSTEEDVNKCKICPQNWRLHKESCYWISDQVESWAKSQEDCRAKNSTLAVIQNTEEKIATLREYPPSSQNSLELSFNSQGSWVSVSFSYRYYQMFIDNFTGKISVWLGLTVKGSENGTWEWVDGSPVKEELFSISELAEENGCFVKHKDNFYFDGCALVHWWICQKIAFQV